MKKNLVMISLVLVIGIATALCLTGCGELVAPTKPTAASIAFNAEYNPTKTYDGTVAIAPDTDDYTTDSNGVVTVEWYTNTDTALPSAPKNAGSYKVRLSVAATTKKHAAVSEFKSFNIYKKVLQNIVANNEYDGNNSGSYTFTEADGVIAGDSVSCTLIFNGFAVGSNLRQNTVHIQGLNKDNYEIDTETFTSTIVKKKLTNLVLTSEDDGTAGRTIRLTTANGIIGEEIVTVTISGRDAEDYVAGAVFNLKLLPAREEVSIVIGGDDANNYLLVQTDGKVGTLTITPPQ